MFESVNNYCERLDPTFWAEPLNAISNIAFLIAALLVAIILKSRHDKSSILLIGILTAIGIGSFLFHTFAQRWAGIADVLPILLFILTYIYFATRRFLGQTIPVSAAAVIGFFPFAIGTVWLVTLFLGPINGSAAYVSVAILIGLYATLIWRSNRKTAIGLLTGAAILGLSIVFRSIDHAVCDSFPTGTHFLWHILNGTMLGWMIIVLSQHSKD